MYAYNYVRWSVKGKGGIQVENTMKRIENFPDICKTFLKQQQYNKIESFIDEQMCATDNVANIGQ